METTSTTTPRRDEGTLLLTAAACHIGFATWLGLVNNFAVQRATFDGFDMGLLQSIREVPGFLALGVVLALALARAQALACVCVVLLGVATAVTGFFPSALGLGLTTFLMSLGFHYYETLETMLALQIGGRHRTPIVLGRLVGASSAATVAGYGLIWIGFSVLQLDFTHLYLAGGGAAAGLALLAWRRFTPACSPRPARPRLVVRRRYGLYYALTFLSGARRQIFIVFAAFLLVERFGFSVSGMAALYLANSAMTALLGPLMGRVVARLGERRALLVEYLGLVAVFVGYAGVGSPLAAALLYVADHLFYSLALGIKTYMQRISDPGDIAANAGIGFTINHIAAVIVPVAFGAIWLTSPAAVFAAGAALAAISAILATRIPGRAASEGHPRNETSARSRSHPGPAHTPSGTADTRSRLCQPDPDTAR